MQGTRAVALHRPASRGAAKTPTFSQNQVHTCANCPVSGLCELCGASISEEGEDELLSRHGWQKMAGRPHSCMFLCPASFCHFPDTSIGIWTAPAHATRHSWTCHGLAWFLICWTVTRTRSRGQEKPALDPQAEDESAGTRNPMNWGGL